MDIRSGKMEKTTGSNHLDSNTESSIVSELSVLLKQTPVGSGFQLEPSSNLCFLLEIAIPQILSCHHSEWQGETLDGIFVASAQKLDLESAQLSGTCILMRDQSLTPFSLRLVLDASLSKLASCQILLGESGRGHLGISGPSCHSDKGQILQYTLMERISHIQWVYAIQLDQH